MELSLARRVPTFGAVISLALAIGAAQAAPPYSQLVAFGDSLSDWGNLYGLTSALTPDPVPAYPYVDGRFANGKVAVEYLATSMGLALDVRAYGGATSGYYNGPGDYTDGVLTYGFYGPSGIKTGLLGQVDTYLTDKSNTLDNQALYLVWAGANDFEHLAPYLGFDAVGQDAIKNLDSAIRALYGAGARSFLVPNMPDFGLTPYGQALGPDVALGLSVQTDIFNAGLDGTYDLLQAGLPGLSLHRVDIADVQRDLHADPGAFGFTNVSVPCYYGEPGDDGSAALCPDATGYFYFDRLHPTTAAHELISQRMLAAAVPEPASMALMALGVLALLGVSARRSAAATPIPCPAAT